MQAIHDDVLQLWSARVLVLDVPNAKERVGQGHGLTGFHVGLLNR